MIGAARVLPRVGINGFTRFARMLLRAAIADQRVDIIALNDQFVPPEHMAYLLKFDSLRGVFPNDVRYTQEIIRSGGEHLAMEPQFLTVDGDRIRVTSEKDPSKIPWGKEKVDYVVDCSLPVKENFEKHLKAGAKRVVLPTNPMNEEPIFVMGINHEKYRSDFPVVHTGDATVNSLAPLAKVLDDNFGIVSALVTSIEGITETQQLTDGMQKVGENWRLGRAAGTNIIPVALGALRGLEKVHRGLKGKLTGLKLKVPSPATSVLDLSVNLSKPVMYEVVCDTIRTASRDYLSGIMGYTEQDVVSQDFMNDSRSCIFDASAGVMLNPNTLKLLAWYDHEWALASRVLDLINYMALIDSA